MRTPGECIGEFPSIVKAALKHGWKQQYEDDDGYFHYRELTNEDGAALNLDNDGTDSCCMYVTRKEDDDGYSYLVCRYSLTLDEAEEVAVLSPEQLRSFLDGRDHDDEDKAEYSEKEVMDNFNDRRAAVMATRKKAAERAKAKRGEGTR